MMGSSNQARGENKMKILFDKSLNRVPIRIWTENLQDIEESCLEQARNLSQLPFLHKWVALMPDTHTGMGMPIGGVIAAKNVIIPNAVGADIGCGMIYVQTDIEAQVLRNIQTAQGTLLQGLVGEVLRNIPVGFNKHKTKQAAQSVDQAKERLAALGAAPELMPILEDSYYQMGTLGGGNHFIEFQEDEEGRLGLMIHSGSRHLGKKIGDVFHKRARIHNQMWHSGVPDDFRLAFLPTDTTDGQGYLAWMQFALDYAQENRECMMTCVLDILKGQLEKHAGMTVSELSRINCHHNYAALEHHYGENVWVHRKGAIRARAGEIGIVPGAMGSFSYLVEGKGNPESFQSCSHGAGRQYSRTKAKSLYSVETVMNDLKSGGVVLGKHNKEDVADESRFAYKDIDTVIQNELDLITPIKKLKTMGVIKG